MPTEPRPASLADVVRRAVEIADPDDDDAVLGEFEAQFEDDDEPVAGVLEDLPRRLEEADGAVRPVLPAPGLSIAEALVLYLAHRRDELDGDPDKVLRLAARAEWHGEPPDEVRDWLQDRGVQA